MPGDQATAADAFPRSALECALHCLTADRMASRSLGSLLADLARAFAADAAGMAQLPDGEAVTRSGAPTDEARPLPWRRRPELIRDIAASPCAMGVIDGGVSWLVAALDAGEPAGGLLWLEAPAARAWSPEDAAALALVGLALARRLRCPGEAPPWGRETLSRRRQQRFDDMTAAVRRVAHDYGNVLTGVLGFGELALGHVPAGSPLASYLGEIRRAAQQGERLTNRLRLLARRNWPRHQPARVAAVVAGEMRRLRGQFPAARLDTALPDDLPAVAIDPEPLRHVLGQLLDNAAEAVASGGSIRLSARPVALTATECSGLLGTAEPGAHVEVAVEDGGCGLSADARRRLLAEPFFTTKTRQRGYGLAVAQGILSAHRGGLTVEPVAGGAGTLARAYLPVAPVAAAAPLPAPGTPVGIASERLLVVDDEPSILQFVRAALERAGYHVQAAASADEALRAWAGAGEPFGLVLCDVFMPRVNGLELARLLRTHDAGANVLFMSGQAVPEAARRQSSGVTFDLLLKPFSPEGLLRAVRSALERADRRPPAGDDGKDDVVRSTTR